MKIKEKIARIIYWWRRYEGIRHKDTNGKFYSFNDLDLLERRINEFFSHPSKFNFDNPDMNIKY